MYRKFSRRSWLRFVRAAFAGAADVRGRMPGARIMPFRQHRHRPVPGAVLAVAPGLPLLAAGCQGDRVAAGAGGEVPAVSVLVRPSGEPQVLVFIAAPGLPACGDEPSSVRGDVPVVQVAWLTDADRDAAGVLARLGCVFGDVRRDLGVVQVAADLAV
jgi:hypothetical protein